MLCGPTVAPAPTCTSSSRISRSWNKCVWITLPRLTVEPDPPLVVRSRVTG
jgi:hypothetical protein